MTNMDIITESENRTAFVARRLAGVLRRGDVVCLHGDLGMGKSVFARAAIRHLCADQALDVPSPTFTLVQIYDTAQCPVWHFDLYRMTDAEDIYELGWDDALADAITIIEWPERLGGLIPRDKLDIVLEAPQADKRRITLTPHGAWRERVIPPLTMPDQESGI